MSDLNFELSDVESAFRKLKRLVYYDKTNLVLRRRIAAFENSSHFSSALAQVLEVLNSKAPKNQDLFQEWLSGIEYFVVQKKIEKLPASTSSGGTFITNLSTAPQYNIEKINYFFDGPIELQLIAVLWLMREGHFLDKSLGPECYGARLESNVGASGDDSADLFCRYHELYKRWRDQGIQKAKEMLIQDGASVCILGLDVQEYYYHAALDYHEIAASIRNQKFEEEERSSSERPSKLLTLIELISVNFKTKIESIFSTTHPDVPNECVGIPIGLISSPLLADWYLRKLDVAINEEIRPAYYGRYVDDIFIVVTAPRKMSTKAPIDSFIKSLLVKPGLLRDNDAGKYEITCRPGLFLQKSKCILQHFDVHHSIAGFEKFQKKLESNASDFLLMPVDEDESSLEEVAYEILYDGSVNKFRSVKGISENRYELAKHLSRQTMLCLLTDDVLDDDSSASLLSFFKGKNAIEFNDVWEKVFTYFYIAGDRSNFYKFKLALKAEISRVTHENENVATQIRGNLEKHLQLSVDMALSLGPISDENIGARAFRKSNLLRHHFVRVPLVNYTDFEGSLISKDVPMGLLLLKKRLLHSPRFVNFDECMLFLNCGNLKQMKKEYSHREKFKAAAEIFLKINHSLFKGVEWPSEEINNAREND